MSAQLPVILASSSPRRKQLLTEAGFVFETLPPDKQAEDNRRTNESPVEYVRRLACQKAQNVADKVERGIILGADTIVLCGERLLEKPTDRNDAQQMLRQLRGQVHRVLSGLCLIKKAVGNEPAVFVETATTVLTMQPISDDLLESYLDSGAWQGKAGAFGYQDGNDWITILEGSESNVVGLPLELFQTMYRFLANSCL
ncbi:MAG: Maf family protein [Planctomycetaceae bacterium]|nr:Maf family protein [Planctomycetaceae bacterium]